MWCRLYHRLSYIYKIPCSSNHCCATTFPQVTTYIFKPSLRQFFKKQKIYFCYRCLPSAVHEIDVKSVWKMFESLGLLLLIRVFSAKKWILNAFSELIVRFYQLSVDEDANSAPELCFSSKFWSVGKILFAFPQFSSKQSAAYNNKLATASATFQCYFWKTYSLQRCYLCTFLPILWIEQARLTLIPTRHVVFYDMCLSPIVTVQTCGVIRRWPNAK